MKRDLNKPFAADFFLVRSLGSGSMFASDGWHSQLPLNALITPHRQHRPFGLHTCLRTTLSPVSGELSVQRPPAQPYTCDLEAEQHFALHPTACAMEGVIAVTAPRGGGGTLEPHRERET